MSTAMHFREAGPTRLAGARNLALRLGLADVRLKLEGENPTGSHKDRAAAAIVECARRGGYTGVTAGTCGNLGVALARACGIEGLECVVFAPARYAYNRRNEMLSWGARVVLVAGSYEDAVSASDGHADERGLFPGSPSREGGRIAIQAYKQLAREIIDGTGEVIDSVWVPVGNGTTLAGLHEGFKEWGVEVALGATGSAGNSAATASIRAGREVELDPGCLRETADNEALVNWRSFHAREVIRAVGASAGWVYDASDEDLHYAAALALECEGLKVPAAAAAGLAGLIEFKDRLNPNGRHVVVVTAG